MPWKLSPGTPSMLAGSRMPCQWIALIVGNVLRTRSVTVSPSRQRRIGPGREPLTVNARAGRPVRFTGVLPMLRSNCVPLSAVG